MNKQFWGKLLVAFVLAMGLSGFASPATAQKKKGSGGIIRLEETIIEGRVQKPTAFFINTRQALVYESAELSESFVDEITKAAKNGPF
jgi:hypothetical protein